MNNIASAPRTCANSQLRARALRLLALHHVPRHHIATVASSAGSQLQSDPTLGFEPVAQFLSDEPMFEPRREFPVLPSLPRSYFLGHHAAGLDRMRALLNQIDLVIECRDARVPFTGRNPLLEHTLSEASDSRRIICYTKRDLVTPSDSSHNKAAAEWSRLLKSWHNRKEKQGKGEVVCFSSAARLVNGKITDEGIVGRDVMAAIKRIARERWSLTGLRVLVAGMPNVGKSTLLNALRARGMKKGKVAKTGADPGVTRKVGGWVKVLEGWEVDTVASAPTTTRQGVVAGKKDESQSEGVYVCDTPGVFMPYVPSSEAMLKLALVGAVKDDSAIIHPVTLADYLLFHLNLDVRSRQLYTKLFSSASGPRLQPTNDIMKLLDVVARRTGRIGKGGKPDIEGTATWLVKKWRRGDLGRFGLDAVNESVLSNLAKAEPEEEDGPVSVSQAKRQEKERRKERGKARFAAKKALAAA